MFQKEKIALIEKSHGKITSADLYDAFLYYKSSIELANHGMLTALKLAVKIAVVLSLLRQSPRAFPSPTKCSCV